MASRATAVRGLTSASPSSSVSFAHSSEARSRANSRRRYAKVGGTNLLLLAFALLDGLTAGFGAMFYAEYALLAALFSMVVVQGAHFGRKLANLPKPSGGRKPPMRPLPSPAVAMRFRRSRARFPGWISRSARRSRSSP